MIILIQIKLNSITSQPLKASTSFPKDKWHWSRETGSGCISLIFYCDMLSFLELFSGLSIRFLFFLLILSCRVCLLLRITAIRLCRYSSARSNGPCWLGACLRFCSSAGCGLLDLYGFPRCFLDRNGVLGNWKQQSGLPAHTYLYDQPLSRLHT